MEEKEEVPNGEMPYEKSIHKEMGKKKMCKITKEKPLKRR
jgi:hypothetical protein